MWSGIKEVKYFISGLVMRCVMDLSWMCSFHWEKVRFCAGVRKSSSHPSVVRFWRGMEWKELEEDTIRRGDDAPLLLDMFLACWHSAVCCFCCEYGTCSSMILYVCDQLSIINRV